MAEIHQTTMTPTKLELLERWLPGQPWYDGDGAPDLNKVGGFRLDDPDGEVGMEFMFVTDQSTGATYHVPMTYRGAALPSAESALIGTSEHGVLGTRWIYDGIRDPVLVTQLTALLHGTVSAQHQSLSDAPDPSVQLHGRLPAEAAALRGLEVVRRLVAADPASDVLACVVAPWRSATTVVSGPVVTAW